ncbi:MAG: hypothetical protein LBU79_02625, partial [Planctomycetota bacterium]|nr:hypothetical protein [Planctomycetota bacterium]
RDANGWNKTLFGGIDGAWVRLNTGSHVNVVASTLLTGVAAKTRALNGTFLAGAFLEGGYGKYDTYNHFYLEPQHVNIRGKGNLTYFGLGFMARQTWDNGVWAEASIRGGFMQNRFHSGDYIIYLAGDRVTTARYRLDTPYVAGHLGLAKEWEVDEQNHFTLLGRYYYALQGGKKINIAEEPVRFNADDLHRVRVGGRYTRVRDPYFSAYVGAYYEYGFSGKVRGSSQELHFPAPDLGGSTGVGEIGIIARSHRNERFSAEFGLQGYVGERLGVTGGVRFGWEF